MNLRLVLADLYIPEHVRRQKLAQLAEATAAAFDCPAPSLAGLSAEERLHVYARFTARQAAVVLQDPQRAPEVQARLRAQAYGLGQALRSALRVSTPAEVMAAARILYRALGISLSGSETGEIEICRCFFSQYYTASVCRLIAALDEGVLAGLAGGGRLGFCQRLTEGHPCCRARFDWRGDRS